LLLSEKRRDLFCPLSDQFAPSFEASLRGDKRAVKIRSSGMRYTTDFLARRPAATSGCGTPTSRSPFAAAVNLPNREAPLRPAAAPA
jgi:hypothetical protein